MGSGVGDDWGVVTRTKPFSQASGLIWFLRPLGASRPSAGAGRAPALSAVLPVRGCRSAWSRYQRDRAGSAPRAGRRRYGAGGWQMHAAARCLLYTSDAADDLLCVDLGGRRIIKKKKKQ